ncbi:MAG TPA: HlyD family type I secretion periplasmic adaptor subunit [bacterium]|nr:HlyD family type I secretion periplasmic adaptor subunit [bacterium]
MDRQTVRYDDGIVRGFYLAAVGWAGAATLATAVWALLRGLGGLELAAPAAAAARAAGILVLYFGALAGGAFMGGYYSLQRLLRVRLWSSHLARAHLWAWQAALAGSVLTLLLRPDVLRGNGSLPWAIVLAFAVAGTPLAINVLATLHRRRRDGVHISVYFGLLALAMGLLPVGLSVLGVVLAPYRDVHLLFPLYEAVQRYSWGDVAWPWALAAVLLGLSYDFIPRARGAPLVSEVLPVAHLWGLLLLFGLGWAGVFLGHALATPLAWGAIVLIALSLLLVWAGGLSVLRSAGPLGGLWRDEPALGFIVLGWAWYAVALLAGPPLEVHSMVHGLTPPVGLPSLLPVEAWGWAALLVAGMVHWVGPRLWEGPWAPRRWVQGQLTLAGLALALYVLARTLSALRWGLMGSVPGTGHTMLLLPVLQADGWETLAVVLRTGAGLLTLGAVAMLITQVMRGLSVCRPQPDEEEAPERTGLRAEIGRLVGADLDFVADARAALLYDAPRGARLILWVTVACIAAGLGWAAWAQVDEVTRGVGRVVPSRQVQVVQNLEGGIISEILVREGDVVQEGQVLLRFDETLLASSYREARMHYLEHEAQAARLRAEADDAPFVTPRELLREAPDLVRRERELLGTRRQQLTVKLGILQQQVVQRKQELAELHAQRAHLQRSYDMLSREVEMTRPLVASGAASEVELLRLERQANDLSGELESTKIKIPWAQSRYQEAERRVREAELEFRNEARAALNEAQAEQSKLSESTTALEDRVQRTEVRSPVAGTVKQVFVSTVGAVMQPGKDLVEIVPLRDTLLVEARIRPSDIGFLSPKQPAIVKFTAYDYAVYGGLKGYIENISADSIRDESGESYYVVRVRTEETHLGPANDPLPIIPGMLATVDILTGKKTVLAYLLKPLLRARATALRER